MKCYSGAYHCEGDNNPYPSQAHTYKDLSEAISKYEEFAQTCENFDQKPGPLWVFFGEPDGDESKYGYPDWPDRIIRVGPRGNVICEECN